MHIDEFVYDLPEASIAQVPLVVRDQSRLLIDHASGANPEISHGTVHDLSSLVGPGDLIVVNTTRVLPARLELHKPTGGAVEVFLLEPDAPEHGEHDSAPGSAQSGGYGGAGAAWEALVRPSRKVPPGMGLATPEGEVVMIAGEDRGEGRRLMHPVQGHDIRAIADAIGSVPTPPYITTALTDPNRYQTVYSEREVSVAAPTAGLHFTPELLAACETAGATVARLELAVGIGTFRPITVSVIADHVMHRERYAVSEDVWAACAAATRVIAIGTTTVRALESAATSGELEGSTGIFISPGYEWKVVDALLTNFHQPRSSLLVMLAAFVGPRWRTLYAEALREGYRFLSFGDAMFVHRDQTAPQ